jgi:hypothetical protein
MQIFSKYGPTTADKILAWLLIAMIGFWITSWALNAHKSYKQYKTAEAEKVSLEKLKNNLLFLIEKQRYSLDKMQSTNCKTVEVTSKTPKELKSALTTLNKSIANHNEITNEYKKQYEKMLKELEETIRNSNNK